jgi:RNA polymerase primary sigma factor
MMIEQTKQREHPQRDWRIHEGRVVTKAQEDRLIRKAKVRKGVPPDERARRELVEYMRPFIAAEARKQVGLGVDFDDLMREGEEAVLHALDAYTPQGWWFASYARSWIHGRMRRAIVNQARTIRVPEYRVKLADKERKARARITQELGRTPTDFEVARELNVPVEGVWKVAVEMAPVDSIDRIAEDAEGDARAYPRAKYARKMLEHLLDHKADPQKILIHKERSRELTVGTLEALRTLESRDRLVFILRYAYGRSRREISEKMGISAKAVRHSEERAYRALRDDKNFRYLWKFVWR